MMTQFESIVRAIKERIDQFKSENRRVFATSSFKTQSAVLLHILQGKDVPVYFIDTGYHFPETIEYKELLTELLDLKVIDILPAISKLDQKDSKGRLLYVSDPDRCCYFNKVMPMGLILREYDVWISGVMRSQTKNRSVMAEEEQGAHGIWRYHPMLDWTEEMIETYINKHDLPRHPLAPSVFDASIGCEPCTHLTDSGEGIGSRDSRWRGLKKTECGLHTELRGTKLRY